MAAALYCVEHKLAHERVSEEERKRLEGIRGQLYLMTRVEVMTEEGGIEDYKDERLAPLLQAVPRTNINLFLDNYTRIRYANIHFTSPNTIEFNGEAILADAAGNPP